MPSRRSSSGAASRSRSPGKARHRRRSSAGSAPGSKPRPAVAHEHGACGGDGEEAGERPHHRSSIARSRRDPPLPSCDGRIGGESVALGTNRARRVRARVDRRAERAARGGAHPRRLPRGARPRDPLPRERAPTRRTAASTRSAAAGGRPRALRVRGGRAGRGRAGGVCVEPVSRSRPPLRARSRSHGRAPRGDLVRPEPDRLGCALRRDEGDRGRPFLGRGLAHRREAGLDPLRRGARLRRCRAARRRRRDRRWRPRAS